MKFLLLSPKNRTVYNFRGDLIAEIQTLGYEVLVTGPDQTDIEKIEALGVRFIEIPMNKNGTSIIADIKYCRRIRQVMKTERPDVVLGYTIKPVVYGAIAAKRAHIRRFNALITGGGYTFTAKSIRAKVLGVIVRSLYRIGLGACEHVIFQNEDDQAEFVEKRLVDQEKCSVVHGSGVNMSHFTPQPYPDESCFLMISRLLKSKGVNEYLKAAELVKRKYPKARFLLLGKYETKMQDAVDAEYVERLIQAQVIERMDETSDVRPCYAQCGVYVLPSYREGTPRTVLEAMASARPVITTDTNGCRETVRDGETGYLVPVGDVEALAEKMCNFIENPELVMEMGERSNVYCQEKFEVHKVNKQMIEIMRLEKTSETVGADKK